MTAFGYILFSLGMLAWQAGNVMFLAVVFRWSPAWFLGCMLVPFVSLIHFLLYPKQTWKPMLIATAGCLTTLFEIWILALWT